MYTHTHAANKNIAFLLPAIKSTPLPMRTHLFYWSKSHCNHYCTVTPSCVLTSYYLTLSRVACNDFFTVLYISINYHTQYNNIDTRTMILRPWKMLNLSSSFLRRPIVMVSSCLQNSWNTCMHMRSILGVAFCLLVSC